MAKVHYQFEEYKDYNFLVKTYCLDKNKRSIVPMHFHNEIEFAYVSKGKAEIVAGKNKFVCNKGDIVLINPLVHHSFVKENIYTEVKGLLFDLSVVEDLLLSNGYNHCFSDFDSSLIQNINSSSNFFIKELFNINKLMENEMPNQLEIIGHIILIIAELSNSGIITNNKSIDSNLRISKAIDYINSNYKNKIYLSELSSLVNMSENNFIRIFKLATSKTPIEYINNYRIKKAIQMLITTDLSIEEISEKTGFNNAPYFTKIFKNALGISPSAYRKLKI